MSTITLPPPDELRRRITDCETELRALRRLLRMSRAAHDADDARRRREAAAQAEGAPDGR
jgi:hypothetical protein